MGDIKDIFGVDQYKVLLDLLQYYSRHWRLASKETLIFKRPICANL
jgi:hypothetical protein